jgi:hypothetical protein
MSAGLAELALSEARVRVPRGWLGLRTPRAAPSTQKRTDTQPGKDDGDGDDGVELEPLVRERSPVLPETKSEDDGEEQKEESGNLKPDDAAHAPEGLKNAADEAAPGVRGHGAGGLRGKAAIADGKQRGRNRLSGLRAAGKRRAGGELRG